MEKRYEAIFSPIQIGNIWIKNRVIQSPMEGTTMIEWMGAGGFRPEVHDFYIERAKDGVGLFIPGMLPVRSLFGGTKWLHDYPEVFEPLKSLLDEIHSYGSKVFIQLGIFSGRNFILSKAMSDFLDKEEEGEFAELIHDLKVNMKAPDEGSPNVWMPDKLCKALTADEIRAYVDAYARSALLCKQAGADGVEIHAVHEGYLMDQFTTPYTNHRTDEYGGSFENRYRFAVETIRAIKDLCGKDFPISMRYSVTSKTMAYNLAAVPGEVFEEGGRTMEESERAIRYLEDAGVDLFNCDNGTYDAWFWAHPPVYMPLNCNLEDVEHIRHFTTKPVYCAGKMQLDTAEQEIAAGRLDGVTIGRQILVDEQFLTKSREGKFEDIRPCIGCHNGCLNVTNFKGVGAETIEAKDHRYCALNSRAFEEKRYTPVQTAQPKKFAVIGAGIGGMEFAIQAAKRGHAVTLYEKTARTGGVFNEAAAMDFKEKDRDLLEWYARKLRQSGAAFVPGREIRDLDELDADEIVIATGGSPVPLKIPGSERCTFAADFLQNQDMAGENIVIIGGGLTGTEIAYQMVLKGKKPVIVEMMNDLIKQYGVSYANSGMLRELMRYHKVPVYLESRAKEVREGELLIDTPEGEKVIPADHVVVCIGYQPYQPFAMGGRTNVHVLGDAEKIGNLRSVIWGADDLAVRLCS